MAEPVVHLELEPRAGEDVDDRGGLELVARQQPAADEARVRIEQAGQLLGVGVPERDVAAEAGADHPHRRAAEVVVAPVGRPRVVRAAVAGRLRAAGPGVVEVLLAEPRPEAGQREDAERQRQPVPAEATVERAAGRDQQLREAVRPCQLAMKTPPGGGVKPQPSQRRRFGRASVLSPSIRAASSRSSASSVVTSSRLSSMSAAPSRRASRSACRLSACSKIVRA